jgi:DNA-binding transcriptional regulator YdaS (Cro superfamily)
MSAEATSAIERAFQILGSQLALAVRLGVTPQAVVKWKRRVPSERVLDIEAATGGQVTRHDLRPDLYPRDDAVA